MQIALNDKNERVYPFRGQEAICPCCHTKVKAFCGETNIYHWRHLNKVDCDSWYEPESEWHITWKNEFPVDWREVVIKKDFKIHRADIFTNRRLVLELQNSPISSEVIREREDYYEKMVWLINGSTFRNNVEIHSLLREKLNEFEQENRGLYNLQIEDYIDFKYKNEVLIEIVDRKNNLTNKLKEVDTKRKRFSGLLLNTRENTLLYFSGFSSISLLLSHFHFEKKSEYNKIMSSIDLIEKRLDNANQTLTYIGQMTKCEIITYEDFVFIKEGQYQEQNYSNYILVDKDTIRELFPKVLKAKSEFEFSIKVKQGNYLVAVNPQPKIEEIKVEITNLIIERAILENGKGKLVTDCEYNLKEFAENNLKFLNSEFHTLNIELSELEKEEENIEAEISETIEYQRKDAEKRIAQIRNDLEIDRLALINKYSDLYALSWKFRHRTWDQSSAKKFIDMGKYIIEITGRNTAKKYSKEQFIELIKGY